MKEYKNISDKEAELINNGRNIKLTPGMSMSTSNDISIPPEYKKSIKITELDEKTGEPLSVIGRVVKKYGKKEKKKASGRKPRFL